VNALFDSLSLLFFFPFAYCPDFIIQLLVVIPNFIVEDRNLSARGYNIGSFLHYVV